jgi:predicted secreted protein
MSVNTTKRALWAKAASMAVFAALLPARAQAQPAMPVAVLPQPQNVMTLAASATAEVPKDWIAVVLSTTREGNDANAVQAGLKTALEAALVEARKHAKPGQVEVRTGAFSLSPRYSSKPNSSGPSISGWLGSTELVVEGRDVAGISQLAGRINTLTIARVGFSLSREAREKVEGEVAAQAIARFRAQADAYARQFGFAGWSLREVQVNTAGNEGEAPMMRLRAAAAPMVAEAALPVEAGKASVTANVSGSVQMTVR